MKDLDTFGKGRSDLDRSPLEMDRLFSRPFWRELRTFLAVAKSRSYAQAALLLNTSAPTVSRDVKRLQEQIGAQLVISSYSGIKLTQIGAALALDLAELDYRLYAMSEDIGRERSDFAGRVTISAPSGLGVSFIAPSVCRLNRSYPDIQIELKDQISFIHFEKNLADIQIGLTRAERSDLVCEAIGVLHLVPVASRHYLAEHGGLDRADAKHSFLQCNYYQDIGQRWRAWNELLAGGRVTHFCENSLGYYALTKSGAGIALLGTYVLLEPDIQPAGSNIHVPLRIYMTAEADRLRSRPVRAVFDWYRALFQQVAFFNEEMTLHGAHSEPEHAFRHFFNLA